MQIPKEDEISLIKIINEMIYCSVIKKEAKSADVIWICHPSLYKYVPKKYQGKIVYDCMDDHVAMCNKDDYNRLTQLERELISKSDIIFASSQYLIDKKLFKNNPVLIRNAYERKNDAVVSMRTSSDSRAKIGYIGTISHWFDFDLLRASVEEDQDIEYYLVGPVEKYVDRVKEESDHIVFEGVVDHSELLFYIKNYDALIMPFKLCDIVLAVDPVKLYEYISYGKCIISVYYPEIERFEPFVYFYHDEKEYIELLTMLKKVDFKPKYSDAQKAEFLENNTWDKRYEIIRDKLERILR